jgi:phosphatidylserine decarboxylase
VPVTVTQVAGLLARSIVSWVQPGQRLAAGERIGMIKLGSQTHLRFPRRFQPLVAVGDRVEAAHTPIARLI